MIAETIVNGGYIRKPGKQSRNDGDVLLITVEHITGDQDKIRVLISNERDELDVILSELPVV